MTVSLAKIAVPTYQAQELEKLCENPSDDVGKGEVLFDECATFADRMRMYVQVVASLNPREESCWTQGVLYDQQGNEIGCTDVGESFLGEYHIWHDGNEYIVEVVTHDSVVKAGQIPYGV